VGNLLGCLYVGCVGCGAARSLLLFGYVSLYCLATLLICICFLPLPSHRGLPQRSSDRGPFLSPCCACGCLGGLGAWRGGSGGISKREVVGSVGLLFGRRISRWNASTSLLCVEVAVGENYSSSVGKAVGNPLGCLYVGCVGCGAARSLLLFGYVSLYCLVTLLICICFLPLPSHRGLPQRSSDRGSTPAALVGGPRWPRCVAWRVGGHF
jgi:hypothetical protein